MRLLPYQCSFGGSDQIKKKLIKKKEKIVLDIFGFMKSFLLHWTSSYTRVTVTQLEKEFNLK